MTFLLPPETGGEDGRDAGGGGVPLGTPPRPAAGGRAPTEGARCVSAAGGWWGAAAACRMKRRVTPAHRNR